MTSIHAQLRLSTNIKGRTRDRCPDVVFTDSGSELATVRTDTEHPTLPLDNGSADELIIMDDALSRVIDEEAWLREFARVLSPGGRIRLTLPAEGVLAWLDSMNAYRYIADISGRGDAPTSANPTGWNRHYTRQHVYQLASDCGLDVLEMHGQNHAMDELRMLAGFMKGNWMRRDRETELRLFPRFCRRNPDDRSAIVTTWSITARKA